MKALSYLLQVAACTGIFFVFYKAVLSRFTFFTINRWYLISTLVLSFVIPQLSLPIDTPASLPTLARPTVQEFIHPVSQGAVIQTVTAPAPINWLHTLPWLYLAVALGFATRLSYSFALLFSRIRGKKVSLQGKIKVIRDKRAFKNGSFLNYIFLDDSELSPEELQQVLGHELVHIRLVHSADRILAKLAQIVLWFNPFSYLYIQAIEENHEFEADRQATAFADRKAYAELLLRLSVASYPSLYHHFSMIPLKKRISMLFIHPTKKRKKIAYVLVLPLIVLSCLAFANRTFKVVKLPAIPANLLPAGLSTTPDATPVADANKAGLILTNKKQKQADSITLDQVKTPVTDTVQRKPRPSAISGLEKLGWNPLVRINGEFMDASVLSSIDPACIRGMGVWSPDPNFEKWGKKIPDGAVELSTKNGVIAYLSPATSAYYERLRIAKTKFFARIPDLNGGEKVMMSLKGGSAHMESGIPEGGKVGFVINGKLYTEDQVNSVKEILDYSTYSTAGTGGNNYKGTDANLSGYANIFFFEDVKLLPMDQPGGLKSGERDYSNFESEYDATAPAYKLDNNTTVGMLLRVLPGLQVGPDNSIKEHDKILYNLKVIKADGKPYPLADPKKDFFELPASLVSRVLTNYDKKDPLNSGVTLKLK